MQNYRQYLILSLILISIQINPALALEDKRDSSVYYYNKGTNLAILGKYELAIELNPKFSRIYNNKGLTLEKLGQYMLVFDAIIRHLNLIQ
ncbi:tetratricopeptide repeat protein [Rickettsia amblyommatis]|uniref:Tetratricopeptide repeat family protein n=1 Tax=Rickettsia amblyommatis str. Ac/Pa TaxID=1359164 RepID=A0A0F3N183_RICAM|nr:tetratricopeptide repeat protein [Rickettsia amblyommatis]KJV61795.1 tetratricopeptide repeat family protein [Rickettsia amblyommatis str. Ac/Pa]